MAACYEAARESSVPVTWVRSPQALVNFVAAQDPDLHDSWALRISATVGQLLAADDITPDRVTGRRVDRMVSHHDRAARQSIAPDHWLWYRYLAGWTGLGWLSSIEHAVGDHPVFAAYRDANMAGWWWPHREWIVTCPRWKDC